MFRSFEPRLPRQVARFAVSLAVVAMLCAACSTLASSQDALPCSELERGPARTVSRIIDGETLALDDGSEVRLVGALAPRALDAGAAEGAWPIEQAAREALGALVLGKTIELAFAGERIDRYGRQQAHVFVIDGERRIWVQGHLLEQGMARAYLVGGNRACARQLLAAESTAREAGRGLWAYAAYSFRQADQVEELLRLRTTFQVIEGRILRVAQVRGTIYLNFDRNWRRGFSVSLRRDDVATLLGEHARDAKALEGRRVRVRGWVEQRGGGPSIDLSSGGHLEVLPAAP